MTDPEWKVDVVAGDETTLIWAGPGLPAAESYWLAIRADPDDLANTMPDDAFLALVDMVRKTGDLDAVAAERDALAEDLKAVVAERDALCDFVDAHDAVEHLIADRPDDPDSYNAAVERLREARAGIDPITRAQDVYLRSDQTMVPLGDHHVEALTPGPDVEGPTLPTHDTPSLDLDDGGW